MFSNKKSPQCRTLSFKIDSAFLQLTSKSDETLQYAFSSGIIELDEMGIIIFLCLFTDEEVHEKYTEVINNLKNRIKDL